METELITSALLLFIGAILAMVLIGFVLMAIALLLLAAAFFQKKPQPQPSIPPTLTASQPTSI